MNIDKNDSALEALRKGRAVIARGWCQKALISDDGTKHCLLGAILIAEHAVHPGAWDALHAELLKTSDLELPEWNNLETTTQQDVLALYDRALAPLQSKPAPSPVADLMARIMGAKIPDEAPSPELVS